MIRLEAVSGTNKGTSFEFDKDSIIIGRGLDCDLRLDDHVCSRQHARLARVGWAYIITDLDSTNGILANGEEVKTAPLEEGQTFIVGQSEFCILEKVPEPRAESGTLIEDSVSLSSAEILSHTIRIPGNNPDSSKGDVERKAKRALEVVFKVHEEITSTLNVKDLYERLTNSLFEHFEQADRVCLFRNTGGQLDLVHQSACRNETVPVSSTVLRRVQKERVGVLASDASEDDRFQDAQSVVLNDVHSMMCAPLTTRTKFHGALYVDVKSIVDVFTREDLELLTLIANQTAYALENATLHEEVQFSFYETVKSLSNALEAKDPYTRGHSDRVANYAEGIGIEYGLEGEQLRYLRIAAELHDIGKIAIRESIIGKKGRLTDEEFMLMKQHPQLGVNILKPIRFLEPILPFVLYHHERYDGTGYPNGLRGDAAPLEARIINLADAFDAMTTQRSYNVPKSIDEALEQVGSEAGRSFDATIVDAFKRYVSANRAQLEAEKAAAKPQESVEKLDAALLSATLAGHAAIDESEGESDEGECSESDSTASLNAAELNPEELTP